MHRLIKRCEENRIIEGYPEWFSKLLISRGVKSKSEASEFLNPSLSNLHDPYLIKDMQRAVELLETAKNSKQKLVIYGDYDVDGVCACAILKQGLSDFGIDCTVYIPDRYQEGYGINKEAIKELAKNYNILLSCDCGITAKDEVDLANSLGLSVIISDHHTPPEILPKAEAVIVPSLSNYPFKELCGAAVAWKIVFALMGGAYAYRLLDLAALATVADMVPLCGENRLIVYEGLKLLSNSQRAGINALKEVAGILAYPSLNAEHIGFQLAPRLNASGRFACAFDAYNLLSTQSQSEAKNLARKLDSYNTQRKIDEKNIIDYAKRCIEDMDLKNRRSIVIYGENFNSGVVGLAAGKIANEYAYPCVVLTDNGDLAVGSGRSGGGINIFLALKECESLFEKFGGHTHAAGLSLKKANLKDFIEAFDEAVRNQLKGEDIFPQIDYDLETKLGFVNEENYRLIEKMEPFGIANPSPIFMLKDIMPVSIRRLGEGQKHLKISVQDGYELRDGIAFGLGHMADSLPNRITAFYSLKLNHFRGNITSECLISHILPGSYAIFEDRLNDIKKLTEQMQKALQLTEKDTEVSFNLPKIKSRGDLLLCYTSEMAQKMHERYPDLDLQKGLPRDKRCFSTICYQVDDVSLTLPYDRLIYCDGLISKRLLISHNGKPIKSFALEKSPYLKDMSKDIDISLEMLRKTYIEIKSDNFDYTDDKKQAATIILSELGLIERDERSGRYVSSEFRKCSPDESWVYRTINELKEV